MYPILEPFHLAGTELLEFFKLRIREKGIHKPTYILAIDIRQDLCVELIQSRKDPFGLGAYYTRYIAGLHLRSVPWENYMLKGTNATDWYERAVKMALRAIAEEGEVGAEAEA